jgi:hypothetical protein
MFGHNSNGSSSDSPIDISMTRENFKSRAEYILAVTCFIEMQGWVTQNWALWAKRLRNLAAQFPPWGFFALCQPRFESDVTEICELMRYSRQRGMSQPWNGGKEVVIHRFGLARDVVDQNEHR